jgi:hypothetical protein
MPASVISEFLNPPSSPAECTFARTTATISADLSTRITPCQFGGTPDCSQCGCLASMALASIARRKVAGDVSLGKIMKWSSAVGEGLRKSA